MQICEEMQKLRAALDKMGIEWVDMSEYWKMARFESLSDMKNYGICRTHFNFNGEYYSVVNGFGSFGGYDTLERENKGLLEIMLPNGNVVGYLTAKEVLKMVKEGKNETQV